jgi:hypothetical protein
MKRQMWLSIGMWSLLLMAGCTGTVTTRTPLFLVVGIGGETNGQVALVEDMFFRDELTTDPRFRFIEESTRPVGGRPIAEDVVDRIDSRSELVVLSRGAADQGGVRPAYLDFFNLEGIEPTDPTAFAPPAGRERLLINDLPTDEPDPIYCPINVQVSRDGRFAALLNHPNSTACSGVVSSPSIDIIDLNTERVVRRVEVPPVLVGPIPQASPGAFFLDQRTNRVYYFQETTGARLSYIQLNEDTGEVSVVSPGPTLPLPGGQTAVDLSRVGDALVALISGTPQLAPIVLGGAAPVAGERTATTPSPLRLIVDEQDRTTAILVLSANQLAVHASITDAEPRSSPVTAIDGTIESNDQFVYLVRGGESGGQIILFDLYTHLASPPTTGLETSVQTVPELVSPAFVTWAQAITPELVP